VEKLEVGTVAKKTRGKSTKKKSAVAKKTRLKKTSAKKAAEALQAALGVKPPSTKVRKVAPPKLAHGLPATAGIFRFTTKRGEIYVSDTQNVLATCVAGVFGRDGYARHVHNQKLFPLRLIVQALPSFIEYGNNEYGWDETTFAPLNKAVKSLRDEIMVEVEGRKKIGILVFDDVPYYLEPETEVIIGEGEDAIGAIVKSCELRVTFFGRYYKVTCGFITNNKTKLVETSVTQLIYEEGKPVKLADLDVRPITPKEKAALSKRGQQFSRYCSGQHYVQNTGTLVKKTWFSSQEYGATGRVMLDLQAFKTVNPEGYKNVEGEWGGGYWDDDNDNNDDNQIALSPDMAWRTSPYLYGFSFVAKQWGRVRVAALSDIQWREDAFDKLVLPQEEKNMIRALVEHHAGSFTDLIDGKGGGCVFLLHGPPGQGKTLTAETVSEYLKKPLYSISVGELGTNPDALEAKLRVILDLAMMWDAVLLLDEADIFLEARDEHDIIRNAMVGVFLRLLEYHQGVLFLTTNRVKNIDSAFYSRISVALKFELPTGDFAKIWHNLLDSARITDIDVRKLAHHDVNGRQIKNAIRLAQTLARAENTKVTNEHIERTLLLSTKFKEELDRQKETVPTLTLSKTRRATNGAAAAAEQHPHD
jgi:hypothetical protein